MRYNKSNISSPTQGLEIEYFIINDACDLEPPSPQLFNDLMTALNVEDMLRACKEYKKGQLEIVSQVHTKIDELRDDLFSARYNVNRLLAKEGLRLLCLSTHPFAKWETAESNEGERYSQIEHALGDNIHRLLVSGTHYHIGTYLDDDTRNERVSQFSAIVPILIAYSASSVFYNGRNTGYQCYRRQITSGIANQNQPTFSDYSARKAYLDQLILRGVIKTDADLWHDVRFGSRNKPTIEIRAADAMPSIDKTVAVAALLQAWEYGILVGGIDLQLAHTAESILRREQNADIAAKHGFQGNHVDADGVFSSLMSFTERFIEKIKPFAAELGTSEWIQVFENFVHESNTSEQMLQIAGIPNSDGAPIQPTDEQLLKATHWALIETSKPPVNFWPPAAFNQHIVSQQGESS